MLALRRIPRPFPQGHPRRLWTARPCRCAGAQACFTARPGDRCAARLAISWAPRGSPRQHWFWRTCARLIHKVIHAICGHQGAFRDLAGPCRIASSEPWSICRQPVAGRAGIGFAGFAQALSTGSSTLAVDSALVGCNAGARQFRGDAPGQRRCGADEIAGSVLQAAPVLAPACMSSACPQGHPRRLWTVSAHMGTLPRPLRGALPNWQAARRRPRRHWLCAVCTGLVHRVVHGGCGLWGADARRRPGAVGRQRMRRAGGSSTPIHWRPVTFAASRVFCLHTLAGTGRKLRVWQ